MAVCTFSVAIDRPTKRDETKKTDFPKVTVFGTQAENCEKFLRKGRLVGIQGRLQTGSYMKDDIKINTTDVVAERVEFLEWGDKETPEERVPEVSYTTTDEPVPSGFAAVEEQIPF
jgi:single-strand DNA-binding protein